MFTHLCSRLGFSLAQTSGSAPLPLCAATWGEFSSGTGGSKGCPVPYVASGGKDFAVVPDASTCDATDNATPPPSSTPTAACADDDAALAAGAAESDFGSSYTTLTTCAETAAAGKCYTNFLPGGCVIPGV